MAIEISLQHHWYYYSYLEFRFRINRDWLIHIYSSLIIINLDHHLLHHWRRSFIPSTIFSSYSSRKIQPLWIWWMPIEVFNCTWGIPISPIKVPPISCNILFIWLNVHQTVSDDISHYLLADWRQIIHVLVQVFLQTSSELYVFLRSYWNISQHQGIMIHLIFYLIEGEILRISGSMKTLNVD